MFISRSRGTYVQGRLRPCLKFGLICGTKFISLCGFGLPSWMAPYLLLGFPRHLWTSYANTPLRHLLGDADVPLLEDLLLVGRQQVHHLLVLLEHQLGALPVFDDDSAGLTLKNHELIQSVKILVVFKQAGGVGESYAKLGEYCFLLGMT